MTIFVLTDLSSSSCVYTLRILTQLLRSETDRTRGREAQWLCDILRLLRDVSNKSTIHSCVNCPLENGE